MTTFRYLDMSPQRLQAPESCTLSTVGTLPRTWTLLSGSKAGLLGRTFFWDL